MTDAPRLDRAGPRRPEDSPRVPTPAEAAAQAGRLKLAADPGRLRLLARLDGEELGLGVTELAEALGVSVPAVGHHLAILRVGGLVEARREGRRRFYRPTGAALGLLRLAAALLG